MSDPKSLPPLKRGFRRLVDEANAEVKGYTVEEAKAMLGRDDVLFVDLRDSAEIQTNGTIEGSLHVPRGMLEFAIDPHSPYHKEPLSSGKKLLFFCASGGRSALAAKTAQDMGVGNVANMLGGYTAWKKMNEGG